MYNDFMVQQRHTLRKKKVKKSCHWVLFQKVNFCPF